MARDIYNVKTIQDKRYDTLDLGEYNGLFGRCESRFVVTLYGHSGSGKSVFALRLADYFAKNIGKTLYNSHEEKINQTLRDRINEWNIDAPRLFFGNALKFERMVDVIRKNYYRAVFIDSVKYMDFTDAQLKELREIFAKRKLAIVMVNFGEKLGVPSGTSGKDLLHASDVKCFFKGGRLNVTSRYLQAPVDRVLFGSKYAEKQLTLF
jgi:hypothetical protein